MEFKKVSIQGKLYGTTDAELPGMDEDAVRLQKAEVERASDHGKAIQQFYTLLAVCHTVMIDEESKDCLIY